MNVIQDKTKALWKGAVLLTVAAIITKILSAAYRIPYQNIAGDVGFYAFGQVYPFYSFAYTLSLYGFPVAISNIVSTYRIKYSELYAKQLMTHLFKRLLIFFLIASLLFVILAPLIAKLMGDRQLTGLLQIISLAFLAVPFLACYRGYYQGMEQMAPTAISQVIEQGARVVTILLLAFLFVFFGYGPYGAALGATIGSVVGMFMSVSVLTYFYIKENRHFIGILRQEQEIETKQITKTVIVNGLFFSLNSLVLVLFQFVDSMTVLRFLYAYGIEDELGKIIKGVYDRSQPLLQLGTMVTTAFSLMIVPFISRLIVHHEQDKAKQYSELSIRFTIFIGLCASLGLAVIIEPVNRMLFMTRDGSNVLFLLSFSIVFSALIMTTSAIMQGYNQMRNSAVHIFFGLGLKVVINIFFIAKYGIMAAAIGTVAGLAFIAVLNLYDIYKKKMASVLTKGNVWSISLTVGFMVIVTYCYKWVVEHYFFTGQSRMSDAVVALSSVLIACILVLFLTIRLKVFTEEELSHIPKLGRLYQKLSKESRKEDIR